jgi:hypothetical protein
MTQYRVLASEGRQRYIYIKTHKNLYRRKKILEMKAKRRQDIITHWPVAKATISIHFL